MIKVSIFYPNTKGKLFDFDYYCTHHIPMIKARLGEACRDMTSEKGLTGAAPGSLPEYIAMAHLYFESTEAYLSAFGPHAKAIMGDILNYTDIRPLVQVSEVLDIPL